MTGEGTHGKLCVLRRRFPQQFGPLLCLLSTGNEEEWAITVWLRKYKASITGFDIAKEWKCSYFLGSHRWHDDNELRDNARPCIHRNPSGILDSLNLRCGLPVHVVQSKGKASAMVRHQNLHASFKPCRYKRDATTQ